MSKRVIVLGAGFGGLEVSTVLSERLGDEVEVTLIDKGEGFVFGFSKLDLMFGKATPDAVRMPYAEIAKPGVRVLRETVTAIDPEARRVTCYIEFGEGRVGSVDIDFLSGPERTGTFNPPSAAKVAEKESFGSTRRARWFG